MPEEVERRALGCQQRRRRPNASATSAGTSSRHLPSTTSRSTSLDPALAHRLLDRIEAEGDPRLFLHDPRPGAGVRRHHRSGGDVAGADVLGQGAAHGLAQRLARIGHRASLIKTR